MNSFRQRRPSPRHPVSRSGAVLVVALVCILIVSVLGMAVVRLVVGQHREIGRHRQQLQAVWLAESAVDRAVVQLQADPEYTGETWSAVTLQADRQPSGIATIRVTPVPEVAGRWDLEIEARYPASSDLGVAHRLQRTVFNASSR